MRQSSRIIQQSTIYSHVDTSVGSSIYGGMGSRGPKSSSQFEMRGQGKPPEFTLGPNPNQVEDEYISNLQEQIHFMELEMKLLREKQSEEAKAGGMAGLFDDDRTHLQHITQVKDKYGEMIRTENEQVGDLEKNVFENESTNTMLKQQLEAGQNRFLELKTKRENLVTESQTRIRTLKETFVKEKLEKERFQTELEKAKLEFDRLNETNTTLKIGMEKDDVMNKLRIERMTDQIKTDENSIANKRKQLNDMNVEHDQCENDLLKNEDLQKAIRQSGELNAKIAEAEKELFRYENNVIELEHLRDLNLKMKENIMIDKKQLGVEIEDLQKEIENKDQLNGLKVQKKLRDKPTKEQKETMNNLGGLKAQEEDYKNKINMEREKIADLLSQQIVITYDLGIAKTNFTRMDQEESGNTDLLAGLKIEAETLDTKVTEFRSQLKDGTTENRLLANKQKLLTEEKIAYDSKIKFIEANYDCSASLKKINIDDLKLVSASNMKVNESIVHLLDKVITMKSHEDHPSEFMFT